MFQSHYQASTLLCRNLSLECCEWKSQPVLAGDEGVSDEVDDGPNPPAGFQHLPPGRLDGAQNHFRRLPLQRTCSKRMCSRV